MSEDDPITLREAAETFFRGRIKVASLRAERDRGNLTTFRIGRQEFTTNKFLREMIKCRVARQAQGFGLTRSDNPGLSETVRASSAQAAALETVQMLKSGSQPISVRSTPRRLATIR